MSSDPPAAAPSTFLRCSAAGLFRRSRGAGRRDAVPGKRRSRERRASAAAAGGCPALRIVRRRQSHQRPEPCTAGGIGRGTERQRAAVAGLLGQPQLASDARRGRRPDGRRRRANGRWRLSPRRSAPIRVAGNISKTSSSRGRRLAPPRRRSTSFGCSTIIRASSIRRPSESQRRGMKYRPSDAIGRFCSSPPTAFR